MARKLGIVTIIDQANYGNRLQNYAVQEVLKSLGFEPETIPSRRFHGLDVARRIRYMREKLVVSSEESRVLEHFSGRAMRSIEDRKHKPAIMAKAAAGAAFSRKHIKQSAAHVTPRGLQGASAKDYEYFVVGSDQVWKPAYRNGAGPEFLDFAPPEKRVAYSASFGVSHIPPIFVARYRAGISSMGAVSVREVAGKDIVEKICGFTPAVTVDPTLVLSRAQWQDVASAHPLKPAGGYVLRYFLSRPTADTDRAIGAFVAERGLASVTLADLTRPDFYDAGPADFLDLVDGAAVICTDSFHGVIFSIIFGRPFVVFTRAGSGAAMNSRIDTLLQYFGLEDRLYRGGTVDLEQGRTDNIKLEDRLSAAREQSMAYLRTALCGSATASSEANAPAGCVQASA